MPGEPSDEAAPDPWSASFRVRTTTVSDHLRGISCFLLFIMEALPRAFFFFLKKKARLSRLSDRLKERDVSSWKAILSNRAGLYLKAAPYKGVTPLPFSL